MQSFLGMLFDVGMPIINQAMAVCPVTGYVLQYRMIHRHESVGAFSIDICLVLLVANILRLNYYPFTPFGTALVFQSLFMIAAQLILLHACARYKSEALSTVTNDSEEDESFWRWSSFTPFWQTTAMFAAGSASLSLVMWLAQVQIYGQLVGLVALLIESVLILPQIIEIFRVGSAQGISNSLIMLNLGGDAFKTLYFFSTDQAMPFKLCGIIQLTLDVFVICQMSYFKLRIKIDQLEDESQSTKQEDDETREGQNSDSLEGSLTRSVIIADQVEQELTETETESHLS